MSPDSTAIVPAYKQVVVPLDGTPFAETVLPVAAQLSRLFDAGLALAAFGVEASDEAELKGRLIELAEHPYEAEVWTGVDWDPAGGLLELLGDDEGSLLCMASHARHGLTGALLGSVSAGMLARWRQPILLVGPGLAPDRVGKGPVVACVDGSPAAGAALPIAAGWADRLQVPLHVVTVAEPVLPAPAGHETLRHHGPDGDPVAYVEGVAAVWRTPDRRTQGFVIYDPVTVAGALADYLASEETALAVVASRPAGATRRALLGSVANDLVRVSPVPVLVVPRPG